MLLVINRELNMFTASKRLYIQLPPPPFFFFFLTQISWILLYRDISCGEETLIHNCDFYFNFIFEYISQWNFSNSWEEIFYEYVWEMTYFCLSIFESTLQGQK